MMPQVIKVRQNFPNQSVADIEGTVVSEIIRSGAVFPSGSTIALAVGSRGIANIRRIVKATADYLKARNCQVFIVPAMGSHGGATAEGQIEILAGYGITEDQV